LGRPHVLDWYVQPASSSTACRLKRLAADRRIAWPYPHVEIDDAISLLDDPFPE
jgi:hypothetical protein